MKHYIITLFNLKLTWGGVDYASNENYLSHRFDLFEHYTMPSIIGQTNQHYTWLVLFSASTPDTYKNRIAGYEKRYPNFTPLFIEDSKARNFREELRKYIKENTNDECVVTTRCDNDDILNIHYIEEVQKNIQEGTEYILSFPNGYQYDKARNVLRKYYFPTSHFTTFVSNGKEKNIYDFLHMKIYDEARVIQMETVPFWVEVIHGENVFNCMGGTRFADYQKEFALIHEFNVDISGKFNTVQLWIMYIYYLVHKIYQKKNRISEYLKRKVISKKG